MHTFTTVVIPSLSFLGDYEVPAGCLGQ